MKVSLIVAVCKKNNGIGKDNQLLWHLPKDMKFFKETTVGFPVITGRKNYESIPERFRPLSHRKNIVLTKKNLSVPFAHGVVIATDLDQALEIARKENKSQAFVIGGGEIYRQFLAADLIDEMLITWVEADLEADTFFSGFNASDWNSQQILAHEVDDKNPYPFTIVKYTRKLGR